MDFLFGTVNKDSVSTILDNTSTNNTRNIFNPNKYVVYKGALVTNTNNIKSYIRNGNNIRSGIYKSDDSGKNPYIKLLEDFKETTGTAGAGLRLKAADLAYLKELGVYPINRMAILRRFPEGTFVYENLEEMTIEPISTVIGWIKPDETFGKIDFKETWTRTDKRFDILLAEIISKNFGIPVSTIVPIPDFAQGILFEFYNRMELLNRSGIDDSVNEDYESYDANKIATASDTGKIAFNSKDQNKGSNWGLNNIPIGDPNVLKEGPVRDPESQNIISNFSFELETTYEQKLLGEVDPGSAMLDILDNIYAMGTSNMTFYWGDASPAIVKARDAAASNANNLNSWWIFVSDIMKGFWTSITDLFNEVLDSATTLVENVGNANTTAEKGSAILNSVQGLLQTILTSTIAIHRFKLRGSIELMTGGKISSTPWYLTLGNPYSPWLATNHIIITAASVETSPEMGFNDQPQWLKAKFTCEFSRSLGKQELMRMFNNTYRRTYSIPKNVVDDEIKKWNDYQKTAEETSKLEREYNLQNLPNTNGNIGSISTT
jgi:hypothetical protein